jgi:hypothetical protein
MEHFAHAAVMNLHYRHKITPVVVNYSDRNRRAFVTRQLAGVMLLAIKFSQYPNETFALLLRN